MVEGDGRQPTGCHDGQGPRGRQRLIAGAVGALWVLGGATSAFAISGEDQNTIELFGIDTSCPTTQNLDGLHICFEQEGEADGSCDLFDISNEDVLSTLLCPERSILVEPELVPTTGPVDAGRIRGSSLGYIRALRPAGASEPTHAITHTFGHTVRTIAVSPGTGATTPCPNDGGARVTLFAGTGSEAFCTAIAEALPKLGVTAGDVRFAIGYDYQPGLSGSNFGGDNFMKVWACGGLNAACSNGSPSALAALAGGGTVLEEVWLRTLLTETVFRIWR